MQPGAISTERLDYMQRVGLDPGPLPADGARTSSPPELRRFFRVDGVGRREKRPATSRPQDRKPRLVSEDVLVGLHGYRLPVAFVLSGDASGVAVHVGTWSPAERENASADVLGLRAGIVESVLRGVYGSLDVEAVGSPELPADSIGGFALGVPTVRGPDPVDGSVGVDRLIRALQGGRWAVVVLAEPVPEDVGQGFRHGLINEMRSVEAAAQAEGAPSALAKHYGELLTAALRELTHGLAVGMWRTGAYLVGDSSTYYRLASAWRAVFSGERSLPDPLRVWDSPAVDAMARDFVLPEAPGPEAPGAYRHPFAFQTLLSSAQLSACVHLPEIETPGFQVSIVPDFDAVPARTRADGAIALGQVIHGTDPTETTLAIDRDDLSRHVFVTGVTGAGKTNTIFHLLENAVASGVPFLVIEPAKREYRALREHAAFGQSVRVYTVGDERVAPLRLNPFEVPEGVPVASHLDLLRSVFAASFGFWTPLPQLLERCLHRVYADRGWELATDVNARITGPEDRAAAFPTLSELVATVEEVIPTLGYEERVSSDLRAALLTRLDSLRAGGKGLLLDVERSTPTSRLLEGPTVLELEPMGDDEDKTFVMGLLLVRLAEQRRAGGEHADLQHLLVIEEAHRLLARGSGPKGEEEADVRGKAVETFANLLAEIRAYGEGVIVADQVPGRLDPSIVKNTNLKVAHRIVAEDDRKVMAGSMAMDERQARALAVLPVGSAAVFRDGEDAALLVRVPEAKLVEPAGADVVAARAPDGLREGEVEVDGRPSCGEECRRSPAACRIARGLVESERFERVFARVVTSTIEEPAALDRLWPDLVAVVRPARRPEVGEDGLLACVATHAAHRLAGRRGAQAGWTYSETAAFAGALAEALLKRTAATAERFHGIARALSARADAPFPMCDRVCRQHPPVCLYRHAAADLVADASLRARWSEATTADGSPETRRIRWEAAMDAGAEIIELPDRSSPPDAFEEAAEAGRRASLCWAQQQLDSEATRSPRSLREAMEGLLVESGLEKSHAETEAS
jgi:uncharacterized protein DUF87